MERYFPGWEEFNGIYGQGVGLQSTAHPVMHPLLRPPYVKRRRIQWKKNLETVEIDLVKGRKKAVLRRGGLLNWARNC